MKLYGPAASTCTAVVIATLFEKEVEGWERVNIDIFKGEQKSTDFVKLNPFGRVPVWTDGDLVLFESRAIARLIAEKYEGQGTPLFGSTPKDKALVNQWIEVESHSFNESCSTVVFQSALGPKIFGSPTDEAVLKKAVDKFGLVLDVYEGHLSNSKYLAGDFFSLADVFHLPTLFYLMDMSPYRELVESRPAVKAWWETLYTRPSWKKWLSQRPPKQ